MSMNMLLGSSSEAFFLPLSSTEASLIFSHGHIIWQKVRGERTRRTLAKESKKKKAQRKFGKGKRSVFPLTIVHRAPGFFPFVFPFPFLCHSRHVFFFLMESSNAPSRLMLQTQDLSTSTLMSHLTCSFG